MASVTITTVWLNLASDPAQTLELPFATAVDVSPSTPGEDRQYGGGRLRSVNTATQQQQAAVAATGVELADVKTLRLWATKTVCYRDDFGTKFYGTYRSPSIVRHQYDKECDVAFTVTETSFSEAV